MMRRQVGARSGQSHCEKLQRGRGLDSWPVWRHACRWRCTASINIQRASQSSNQDENEGRASLTCASRESARHCLALLLRARSAARQAPAVPLSATPLLLSEPHREPSFCTCRSKSDVARQSWRHSERAPERFVNENVPFGGTLCVAHHKPGSALKAARLQSAVKAAVR